MPLLPPDPRRPILAPAPPPRRVARLLVVVAGGAALFLAVAALASIVVMRAYLQGLPPTPSGEELWAVRRTPGITFLDRNGQVIATRGAKYGTPVTLASLPAYAPRAFLAAEDRRFYQHGPLDFRGIARALVADVRAHRIAQGASTLTQQLARTLFLTREESLKRKVQEAYLAWSLEQSLTKDQILELYLNRTYFGAGAYGLDAAAQTYFGKPASRLTLAEAALLAGLPNAPSRLAPTNDIAPAEARARRILTVMRQQGWISQSDFLAAASRPPALAPPPPVGEGDFGYALDQAAAEALQLVSAAQPDLVIRTTIDPVLQKEGARDLRDGVLRLGAHRRVGQGALVSLAPDGAIVALVGGLDHDKSAFDRVFQAKRQPGSAFKAFVYGAALERGLTPADVREDAPIRYGDWDPENYHHDYLGPVTLSQALALSLNTVSVRLTLEVGAADVADFARRCGLADVPPNPGPSIALGAYEVTPLELAAGYQVFQTGGGRTEPYLVSEVRSARGDILYAHAPSAPVPVYEPLLATRMVGMLEGVIASGTGTAANIGRPAAGKTGTSSNYRDAWFVGFTPDILTAVWVGNDDGAPMAAVTGGEIPAQIWRAFMTAAEKNQPVRDFPWLVPEAPAPTLTAADAQPPPEAGSDQTSSDADTDADMGEAAQTPDWSQPPDHPEGPPPPPGWRDEEEAPSQDAPDDEPPPGRY